MWQATYEEANDRGSKDLHYNKKRHSILDIISLENRYSQYFKSTLLDLKRCDPIVSLVESGCSHLSLKIFQYLDSQSLLAASLVCRDWQYFLLEWFYARPRFRGKIYKRLFEHQGIVPFNSKLTFTLGLARSAIIDVTVDDDLNLFALALLSGRPHVMACSLFAQVS